jgi:hypothetical protein
MFWPYGLYAIDRAKIGAYSGLYASKEGIEDVKG